MRYRYALPSIVIGGIGGSGTRAVAEMFMRLNYFMGYDLNDSNDNLLYTLIFKRKNILIETKENLHKYLDFFYRYHSTMDNITLQETKSLLKITSNTNLKYNKEWFTNRVKKCLSSKREKHHIWGWKEPNTHIIIDKIIEFSPNVKFIYVYRNGLDMAFSENQNQLKFWGDIFLNKTNIDINPKNSLKFWCIAHKRMLNLQKIFYKNIYLLDFDKLCINTKYILNDLYLFLGDENIKRNIKIFENFFISPSSTGRYNQHSLDQFDKKDLNFIKKIYK